MKNHGYVDGNQRVAFMAAYVFLGVNGYDIDAEEAEVATTIERAGAGEVSEVALADWLRTHLMGSD